MKVKDLIAKLQTMDVEQEVLVAAPDGCEPYAIGRVTKEEFVDHFATPTEDKPTFVMINLHM